MKINQLLTLLLISLICVIEIKSQESCENFNNDIFETTVVPRHLGVFKTLEITNAVNMTFTTNLDQYFAAELDIEQGEIKISTTENFANYEWENNSTRTVLNINIRCSSSNAVFAVRITISSVNNFAPEFTASKYEIKIPTPLAKGTEITAYLGFDDQIAATDYDLYDNRISYALTGSDLFYVESVDITGVKSTFKARIFTSQQIIKLNNDEVEFTLTAKDSSSEPKSSSVNVKVFTDPENIFIESPKFSKPLYRGELEKGGILTVEDITLDEATYDDNVKFEIVNDVYGIINLTSVGPAIKLTLKEEDIPEEVFKQKFIDFIIEAKRDGDNSGFTVIIIEISSPVPLYAFGKSLYEGDLKEKGRELNIENLKILTNGSLEGTGIRLSQDDADYFEIIANNDIFTITLKVDVPIDEIMTKTLLFFTVEAVQNDKIVASTNVIIKTIALLIPQFDKSYYTATIENEQLQYDRIFILEESISQDEEIEVFLIGTDSQIFDVEINKREVTFELKAGAEVPNNKYVLNFQIQVNNKGSSIKSYAVLICEVKTSENSQEALQFNSQFYEGKITKNLTLSLPEIILNNVEDVDITLSGKHADYFEYQFNQNYLVLTLKNGIDVEQFSTDYFLLIQISASRMNFTSATSYVIIGIENNSVIESAFEKSLYIGNIDDQTLYLESLIIKSEKQYTNVKVTGDDGEYFSAEINNNAITLQLVKDVTKVLLLQKTILNAKITADYEDSSVRTNVIVTLPRPDQINKLSFETSYTSGRITNDSELMLEIGDFSLNSSNYDDTVHFVLSGIDASMFSLEQNSNKVQLKLNMNINEEQLNSKKFISLSVIATKEEFEAAEHFIFINVEIFNSSDSNFEESLYVGTVDDQRNLNIGHLIIKSDHEFSIIEFIGEDSDYFKASIVKNQITISLALNISEDLLVQKSILSSKVTAKYDDIEISTNLIVKLPRPDEIKKLKFDTSYTSGTIKKVNELILEVTEFSLNPSNYDENVKFILVGNDAHLFSFEQNSNKVLLKFNQGISEDQITSKKYIMLSLIATREEFEDAEHFIFINVEIYNSTDSSFENNLYVGYVDDQRSLHLNTINIISEHLFKDIKIIDDDFEYFNVSVIQNKVVVNLAKEITQDLLVQKTILSAKLLGQFDDIMITTNIIVTLPRPEDIQSLKFESSHTTGKIITHPDLSLKIAEIALQTGNYNENVEFTLDGVDADLFDMIRNTNKIQLYLKSELNSEILNNKEVVILNLIATRQDFLSAEHFIYIYIEKSSAVSSDSSFDKSLYIGNIDDQKVLHLESITIKSNQTFNNVEIVGTDAELLDASIDQNTVTIHLKQTAALLILPHKGFLYSQIVAKSEDISIYTNLIIDLPNFDENQKLSFETAFTVGNLNVYPQTKLIIQEIVLESTNYDLSVQFNITGNDANLFELRATENKILLSIKSEINKGDLENKEYITLTLTAFKEQIEKAEHYIFINIVPPEIVESSFDQYFYLGSIDNQKALHLDPLPILNGEEFNEVMVVDDDFEFFSASLNKNYVTITLIKDITEDVLLKTSLLSTKVIAKSEDLSISTHIIVTLPKVNGDKILRFESPYYIGSIEQLALNIEDIVLELNNYDETIEFSLSGSDKELFKFENNQNSVKLSLASGITQEDLQNRVFLSVFITATRDKYVTAETVIFVHLNVIVEEISLIAFDHVIYTGSLSYNNVLVLDKISLTSNETDVQISHKGDNAGLFKINYSDLMDIQLEFIPQAIDFDNKYYFLYIEAIKFGAPKAYATVVIELVDKVRIGFDKINYFGSFDEQGNLMIDHIHKNSALANSNALFRLIDGQSEFFGLESIESSIQITKEMSFSIENLSFIWFYLEAYGSDVYSVRTLIVIDIPQNIDTPIIDECYDKLDPTQPYFETGSYSFTVMSDETGLVGQIRAIITDPEDSIASYGLLFENIFLYDKVTIDKGDIKLLVQIPAGFYRMKGIALSMNSRITAETSILLRVLEPKTCENGSVTTTVQKSLAIVKIEENEIYNQIMYMMIGDCKYEITKIVPDVLKTYLEIDNSTHYLKNTVPFDREDTVFDNYKVPQLQITLHLVCPTSYFKQLDSYSIQPLMNEVFTDEILYSPYVTYLNLEILDQNDNPPIFTNPPSSNYKVAFPDESLMGLIMPKYLFKVEAYDIDDGINAVIRYSTSMPSTFEINSVTGEINPLRTLPDEPTGFLITAIDRQGAGLRTTTSIDFVKISRSNVIEIVANNYLNQDIDELALELSEKLNADFRVLSSTQLPFTTNSQILRFADTQAKTKVYGYAFKSNSLDLITPKELMDQLKDLNLTFSINYSEVDECLQENHKDECDLTMWIFVVSFMGSILAFIIIAIPIFWYCYLKKRLQNPKDNNSESSKEEIANHFYENDSVRDSDIASEIVEAITEMRSSDAEIIGIGVNGVTQGESSTDAERLSNKLMSILEPSSPIHDRKVKFNEMVERIEVIDDPDPDTDDIPSNKRY